MTTMQSVDRCITWVGANQLHTGKASTVALLC